MFESVVLKTGERDASLTLGAIAESLLFYQHTRLMIGPGSLIGLAKSGAFSDVLKLIKKGRVKAVHCEEVLCTISNPLGALQVYDFGTTMMIGHKEERGRNRAERIEISLRVHGIDPRLATTYAKQFVDLVPKRSWLKDDYLKGGILPAARADALDVPTLRGLIAAGLAAIPGGYDPGNDLEVDPVKTDLGYFLFTNIDFVGINKRRASLVPAMEPVTLAHILNLVLDSRADMHVAAFYGGDFVTSTESSALVRWRQKHLFDAADRNLDARQQFQQLVLPDYPNIGAVIDRGERSWSEFEKLLDKAAKFKVWLADTNPDQQLAEQYIQALKKDTWADRAPAKFTKYLFSLGTGLLDPTAGVVSGAADAFLVDKFVRGWRPNHFVDDKLKPFLGSNNER